MHYASGIPGNSRHGGERGGGHHYRWPMSTGGAPAPVMMAAPVAKTVCPLSPVHGQPLGNTISDAQYSAAAAAAYPAPHCCYSFPMLRSTAASYSAPSAHGAYASPLLRTTDHRRPLSHSLITDATGIVLTQARSAMRDPTGMRWLGHVATGAGAEQEASVRGAAAMRIFALLALMRSSFRPLATRRMRPSALRRLVKLAHLRSAQQWSLTPSASKFLDSGQESADTQAPDGIGPDHLFICGQVYYT